jgi:hypothetical protein
MDDMLSEPRTNASFSEPVVPTTNKQGRYAIGRVIMTPVQLIMKYLVVGPQGSARQIRDGRIWNYSERMVTCSRATRAACTRRHTWQSAGNGRMKDQVRTGGCALCVQSADYSSESGRKEG